MARVLILRDAEAAAKTAQCVADRGHEPLILPLEETVVLDGPPPEIAESEAWAGFAATSARAIPSLAAAFHGDARPLLAVGEATAAAAREAGFPHVWTAGGNAAEMGHLALTAGLKPGDRLLCAVGRRRTGTLESALDAAGISWSTWEVYEVRPRLPERFLVSAALEAGPIDHVLVLSVGQAEGYQRMLAAFPELGECKAAILALSPRIAAALPADLARSARISAKPSLSSLFEWLS